MDIFVTGIVVIVVCFLVWSIWLNKEPKRPSTPLQRSTNRVNSNLDDAMKRLVTACLGDKAKAQRLLEYEKNRNPNLRTSDAIQNALDRLERDRR